MTRCYARTRAGNACTNAGTYAAPGDVGALLCLQHAASAGVDAAKAEQAARLAGHRAKSNAPRRRAKAAADPVAGRIAELQRLADVSEKRRDLQLAARYHEMIGELVAPVARAAADAVAAGTAPAPAEAPTRVPLRDVLAHLSDEEIAALKLAAVGFARALDAIALNAPPPPVGPDAPARPTVITTNDEETTE